MKVEEIQQLVDYYEDMIVTNFEMHFSRLVLMDFYEDGYDTRTEDEFYYEEYFERYEIGIRNLLLDLEEEMNDEFMDFKLRLIKLKRIIDTKLYKIDIEEKNNPLGIQRKRQFILNSNIDKDKFINILYEQLNNYKLINVDFKDFIIHFSNNYENKIQWLGTELQITNLITLLIENEYLTKKTNRFKYKLIESHFTNKKGEPFKRNQLSSVFTENKEKTFEDITNVILDEISTHLSLG